MLTAKCSHSVFFLFVGVVSVTFKSRWIWTCVAVGDFGSSPRGRVYTLERVHINAGATVHGHSKTRWRKHVTTLWKGDTTRTALLQTRAGLRFLVLTLIWGRARLSSSAESSALSSPDWDFVLCVSFLPGLPTEFAFRTGASFFSRGGWSLTPSINRLSVAAFEVVLILEWCFEFKVVWQVGKGFWRHNEEMEGKYIQNVYPTLREKPWI